MSNKYLSVQASLKKEREKLIKYPLKSMLPTKLRLNNLKLKRMLCRIDGADILEPWAFKQLKNRPLAMYY